MNEIEPKSQLVEVEKKEQKISEKKKKIKVITKGNNRFRSSCLSQLAKRMNSQGHSQHLAMFVRSSSSSSS